MPSVTMAIRHEGELVQLGFQSDDVEDSYTVISLTINDAKSFAATFQTALKCAEDARNERLCHYQ